jgi:hypothetical protein
VDEDYSGKELDAAIKLRLEAGAGFKNIGIQVSVEWIQNI